jgi:hypothetical protein
MATLAREALLAKAPEDLFGPLTGTRSDKLGALARRYKQLALAVHPDRASDAERDLATRALSRVTLLRRAAEHKIELGLYGNGEPTAPAAVIRTRRRVYSTLGPVLQGDLCDLYPAESDDEDHPRVLLKVARCAEDNDLVEGEARTLRALFAKDGAASRFLRYLPEPLDSMTMEDGRRANVLPLLPDHRPLEATRGHVGFRDVAWMAKRVFAALGFVHARGFVHGAVLPPHVLVHPVTHGAVLVDLCYAVPRGQKVPALVPAFRDLYPDEVRRGEPAEPGTDVYMAAKTLLWLLPANAPKELRTFFESCAASRLARRPDDAWALHEELDQLLLRLWGKPTYQALSLPD